MSSRRDSNGQIIGALCICVDASRSRDATAPGGNGQRAGGEEAEVRLVIEHANAPIFGVDASGKVNEWNLKAVEITGYTKEEVRPEPPQAPAIGIHEAL